MTDAFQQTDQRDHTRRILRVLLAEPHPLVREGLRRRLEAESDVEVIAEAESDEEALIAAQRFHPDLAIIDLVLPERGGIEAIQALKAHCPATAVVALSTYDDEPYRKVSLEAGAIAFVPNNGHGHVLLTALLSAISRGEAIFLGEPSERKHIS